MTGISGSLKKKRSIAIPSDLGTYYKAQSLTELVYEGSIIYEVKYWLEKQLKTWQWTLIENTAYEDSLDPEDDFKEKGREQGLRESFLNVLWEQIERRVQEIEDPSSVELRKKNDAKCTAKYDSEWRVQFLRENPQYRNKIPAPPDCDQGYFTRIGIQDSEIQSIVTSKPDKVPDVPNFLSNPMGNKVMGVTKKVHQMYMLVQRAWLCCGWCYKYNYNELWEFYPAII